MVFSIASHMFIQRIQIRKIWKPVILHNESTAIAIEPILPWLAEFINAQSWWNMNPDIIHFLQSAINSENDQRNI